MSDVLPYTIGTRIPRLLGVRNYLKKFCKLYTSDALPYTLVTRIPRLLAFRNYLNNYFAMYKRLTRSRICLELASRAYLGLRII